MHSYKQVTVVHT